MRQRERILSIRKQSKDRISRENLWFFNEESVYNPSSISPNKIGKNDGFRGIREDYDPFITKSSEKNKFNKECLFVVDWQLTDA